MIDLNTLTLTAGKRFKIPLELKDDVLPKYPTSKNVERGTFSCSLQQLAKLKKGGYKYLLYSTGETAYLFEAALFQERVVRVDYENKQGMPAVTQVGYIKDLITQGKYLASRELING